MSVFRLMNLTKMQSVLFERRIYQIIESLKSNRKYDNWTDIYNYKLSYDWFSVRKLPHTQPSVTYPKSTNSYIVKFEKTYSIDLVPYEYVVRIYQWKCTSIIMRIITITVNNICSIMDSMIQQHSASALAFYQSRPYRSFYICDYYTYVWIYL